MKSLLQSIGEYRILEKLGRGGMADVFLALDTRNQRRIALKLVERGMGEDAREIVAAERLGAELQANLSRIEPRVPRIHAFGDIDDYFFIDMEFIEGKDLSEIIRAGVLDPDTALNVARELCSILRHAHALSVHAGGRDFRAIVHGDIKPRNIRIEPQGQVHMLDFGIAKGLSLTRRLTGNLFGSVAYSSPERLESGRIDEMSDLWSVGVVLYEMIEGRLPFEAASTERLETIVRSCTAPRPLGDPCPVEVQYILHKALARSSGRRYQTAEEFEADLQACLCGTATRAGEESEATRRTGAGEDEETRRTSAASEAQPAGLVSEASAAEAAAGEWDVFRRSHPRLYAAARWALSAVALLIVGLGLWEGTAYRSAIRIKPDFAGTQVDPDSAWMEYQQIRQRSLLGIAPLPLRLPMQIILHDGADKIVDEYRNSDQPKTREADWVRCKRYMARAVELEPADRKAAATFAYAEGHIQRINHKDLDAVAAFQRAAALEPKWPDPYLGMARTYIYNLQDIERGIQSLEHARDLGYNFGKRELTMTADARKTSGYQAWNGATKLRGTEQEVGLLKKAQDSLKQAIDAYAQIVPWGDSTNQIVAARNVLTQVEDRLNELNPPNPLLPWNWFRRKPPRSTPLGRPRQAAAIGVDRQCSYWRQEKGSEWLLPAVGLLTGADSSVLTRRIGRSATWNFC